MDAGLFSLVNFETFHLDFNRYEINVRPVRYWQSMYRALREFNRPCVMADRDRHYRKHQEALRRIQSGKVRPLSPPLTNRTPRHSPTALHKRTATLAFEQPKTAGRTLVQQIPPSIGDNLPSVDVEGKRAPSRIQPVKYCYGFENSIAAINPTPGSKHVPF
jgi:hypothetical protein